MRSCEESGPVWCVNKTAGRFTVMAALEPALSPFIYTCDCTECRACKAKQLFTNLGGSSLTTGQLAAIDRRLAQELKTATEGTTPKNPRRRVTEFLGLGRLDRKDGLETCRHGRVRSSR